MKNAYSTQKLSAHPEVLADLRSGGPGRLLQVHLMWQNTCNQNCSFCVADATVLLASGPTRVENVRVGDKVAIGDLSFPVTAVHDRMADDLYLITLDDGATLKATAEHPILTEQGFVPTDALAPGYRVAADVRVRVRGASPGVGSRQEVGLESLSARTPDAGPHEHRAAAREGAAADARQQSHEEPRFRRQDAEGEGGQALYSVGGGNGAHPAGRQKADAVGQEPDEEPGDGRRRDQAATQAEGPVADGAMVLPDSVGGHPRPGVGRSRGDDGRGEGSGLPHRRDGHGHRGVPEVLLQRGQAESANRGGLRDAPSAALRKARMAMPRGVHAVAQEENPGWSIDDAVVLFRGRPVRGLETRRVVSVERLWGQHRVYNLTVDGAEAFVANGILTHNCSYRMDANKNSEAFDKKKHLSVEDLGPLLEDFKEMGVQAIELTGGGEPLLHPQFDEAWELLAAGPWDIGIVTNGTMLTEERAKKVVPRLKWLRISIDAANEATYATMRRTPRGHFGRARGAVESARANAPDDPEFRLGVGFVLSNENWREVYGFVGLAKSWGADNVRLSSTFSDKHSDYFYPDVDLKFASASSEQAKAHYEDDTFAVHNHIPTRLWETEHPEQDYDACYTKDLLCVVEGEGKVYTCCTFTGSEKGCYGNYLEHPGGFRGLWEEAQEWRQKFRACDYCKVSCLYRDRNLEMIGMVEAKEPPQPSPDIIHKNFI